MRRSIWLPQSAPCWCGSVNPVYVCIPVASLAGHEFHFKQVFVLATVLAAGSYMAFVWALNLQFPVWPSFIVG